MPTDELKLSLRASHLNHIITFLQGEILRFYSGAISVISFEMGRIGFPILATSLGNTSFIINVNVPKFWTKVLPDYEN